MGTSPPSAPALILSVAVPEDMDAITRCQFSAFYPHDVFHDIIWPGPPTPENLEKNRRRQMAWMAADGRSTYLKVRDATSGEIVAGAKWCMYPEGLTRPARLTVDWYGQEGSEDRAYAQFLMDEFQRRRVERMNGPHCLLDICFCSPLHQRRGAGTQLVQWGVQKADELGVEAFVEASLAGRRLYEKNGFAVTEHVQMQPTRWASRPLIEYLFMHRRAKGA